MALPRCPDCNLPAVGPDWCLRCASCCRARRGRRACVPIKREGQDEAIGVGSAPSEPGGLGQ